MTTQTPLAATPRTEAAVKEYWDSDPTSQSLSPDLFYVEPDFARQLERENQKLREAVRKLGVAHEEVCPSKAGCATLIEARAALGAK